MLRDARPADAAAVAAVQARSWARAYRGIVPDDYLDALDDETWRQGWVDGWASPPRDGVHRLVSTDDEGTVVAFAVCGPAIAPRPDASAQLYVLYADPAVWGAGHGGALLREVHRRLADDGHAAAELWVAAENQRSIAIYEHVGWVRDGASQVEDVRGVEIEEVRMVRAL